MINIIFHNLHTIYEQIYMHSIQVTNEVSCFIQLRRTRHLQCSIVLKVMQAQSVCSLCTPSPVHANYYAAAFQEIELLQEQRGKSNGYNDNF